MKKTSVLPILLRALNAKLCKEGATLCPAKDTSNGCCSKLINRNVDGHGLTHETLSTLLQIHMGLARAVCICRQENTKHVRIQSVAISIEHVANFFDLPELTFLCKSPCQCRIRDFARGNSVGFHGLEHRESTLSVANLGTGINDRSVGPDIWLEPFCFHVGKPDFSPLHIRTFCTSIYHCVEVVCGQLGARSNQLREPFFSFWDVTCLSIHINHAIQAYIVWFYSSCTHFL